MLAKAVHIEGVGNIILERSRRAKRINLSVKPFQGVRVAVPQSVSFQQAEEVARSKSRWLKKHLDRMAGIEKKAVQFLADHPIQASEARASLERRVRELAAVHGFACNRIFIRNQKTRWGSCSPKNNINLNIHVIQLPAVLIDYIILHELVHTRIRNHSRRFWNEMAKYIAQPRLLDRELNHYEFLLCG